MDRFEADVMDDLMYEASEGPAARGPSAYDEYDEGDEGDEFAEDWGDEGDDQFIGRLLGGIGRVAGGLLGGGGGGGEQFDEGDEFDAGEEYDEGDGFEAAGADYGEDVDSLEDAVADALDSEDADEFFSRLRRLASGAMNVARRVGQGVGQAARVIGPLASMIPIPQAQMIGRIANVAGRLLADGADEFEAFDDLVDGLDEDAIDAAAPVLAGMVLRRAVPAVARAAAPVRRAAVRSVTRAVRQAVRRQGPPAARAVARAVRATRRVTQARRMPPRAAARVVQRAAQTVARQPQAVRRLARPLVPAARRATPRGPGAQAVARTVAPAARRAAATTGPAAARRAAGGVGVTTACPRCGGRRMVLRGPVTIHIRGR